MTLLENPTLRPWISLACLAVLVLVGRPSPGSANDFATQRNRMVDEEIVGAGVKDPRVIQAMRDTPRHEFVTSSLRPQAYYDMAMAIGHGQTISPPFVVTVERCLCWRLSVPFSTSRQTAMARATTSSAGKGS